MTKLFVGLTTIDIQYYVHEFPKQNGKIKTNPPSMFVGGPAANAAIASAALGDDVLFVTSIGNTPFKQFIMDDMKSHGVKVIDLMSEKEVAPVIATVITSINGGDRSILSHFPSNVDPEDRMGKIVRETQFDAVLIDGFYPEVAKQAIIEAKKQSIPVVFDGGSYKSYLPDLFKYIDYAICSNDFNPDGLNTVDDIFSYLESFGIEQLAITRGGDPLVTQSSGKRLETEVNKVEVVDTLGAGDFLHGAFMHYLSSNNFEESIKKASRVASFSCSFPGTRSWIKELNTL